MTKEEATRKAEEENEKEPEWFCPLASQRCRKDCLFFEKAECIWEIEDGKEYAYVSKFDCKLNAMVWKITHR